ncbi:AMP-binding protein [Bacillus cytotoxicus]
MPFDQKVKPGDRVAYVIFTSGSTGLPKGVVETHYQVMNTLWDLKKRLSLDENDNFLCLASFNFDLSVFDIFGSVFVGGTLYIAEDQRDFATIKNVIEKHNITIWNSVPSVLDYFLKEIELSEVAMNKLRVCMMSGDYVSTELSKTVLNTFPNSQTYSLGGATECSIWSILYLITKRKSV